MQSSPTALVVPAKIGVLATESRAQIQSPIRNVCTWAEPQPREPCVVMQGHTLADDILDDVKASAELVLRSKLSRKPCLAIILVGNDPASHKYVRSKVKAANAVGMEVRVLAFPSSANAEGSASSSELTQGFVRQDLAAEQVTTEQLVELIEKLNKDTNVDGIIVQLPLPSHVCTDTVTDAVAADKDVDGFGPRTRAALVSLASQARQRQDQTRTGTKEDSIFKGSLQELCPNIQVSYNNCAEPYPHLPSPRPDYAEDLPRLYPRMNLQQCALPDLASLVHYPCTPLAIMALLHRYKVKVANAQVAVLGRGQIVGEPLLYLLLGSNARVASIVEDTDPKLSETALKQADIVIAAIGQPGHVKGTALKDSGRKGPVVIDVGINFVPINRTQAENVSGGFSFASMEDLEEKMVQQRIPPRRYDCIDHAGRQAEKARNVKMVGDVDAPSVRKVARLLTPVPGGVGPLTVAMLLRNTVVSALCRANEVENR